VVQSFWAGSIRKKPLGYPVAVSSRSGNAVKIGLGIPGRKENRVRSRSTIHGEGLVMDFSTLSGSTPATMQLRLKGNCTIEMLPADCSRSALPSRNALERNGAATSSTTQVAAMEAWPSWAHLDLPAQDQGPWSTEENMIWLSPECLSIPIANELLA